MYDITVLKSVALKTYIVLRTQVIDNKPIFCTLSGRTGGYPDDDLIKLKKKKKGYTSKFQRCGHQLAAEVGKWN